MALTSHITQFHINPERFLACTEICLPKLSNLVICWDHGTLTNDMPRSVIQSRQKSFERRNFRECRPRGGHSNQSADTSSRKWLAVTVERTSTPGVGARIRTPHLKLAPQHVMNTIQDSKYDAPCERSVSSQVNSTHEDELNLGMPLYLEGYVFMDWPRYEYLEETGKRHVEEVTKGCYCMQRV
jgi:hypothetical protein